MTGLLELAERAPAGCHCTDVCMAPRIMGSQQPCRRVGGVPGEKAPPTPATLNWPQSQNVIDPAALDRWREYAREGNGHDMCGGMNKNTLARLINTIDRLSAELRARATPSESSPT